MYQSQKTLHKSEWKCAEEKEKAAMNELAQFSWLQCIYHRDTPHLSHQVRRNRPLTTWPGYVWPTLISWIWIVIFRCLVPLPPRWLHGSISFAWTLIAGSSASELASSATSSEVVSALATFGSCTAVSPPNPIAARIHNLRDPKRAQPLVKAY